MYAFCWVGAALAQVGTAVAYQVEPTDDIAEQRATLAYDIFALLTMVANMSLNLTILLTYLKFSDRLESATAERAKDQLRQ